MGKILSEALVRPPLEVIQRVLYLPVLLSFFFNKPFVSTSYAVFFILAHSTTAAALACGKKYYQPSNH